MSDSARRLPRIEGRGNWAVVRPVFEQRFKSEGLWDAVSNKTAGPESDKAKALILENIASDLVALVDATQTAGHAWALLITLFSGKSRGRIMALKMLLFGGGMKRRDGEEMAKYVSRWVQLKQDLAGVSEALSDEDLAWGVLAGLPVEYQRAAFAAVPEAEAISISNIVGTLAAFDLQTSTNASSTGSGSTEPTPLAMATLMPKVGQPKGNQKGKPKGNPKGSCVLCQESGHWASNCPMAAEFNQFLAFKKQNENMSSRALQVASVVNC